MGWADKLNEAASQGYSADEINSYVGGKVEEAKAAGYSDEEIASFLGVNSLKELSGKAQTVLNSNDIAGTVNIAKESISQGMNEAGNKIKEIVSPAVNDAQTAVTNLTQEAAKKVAPMINLNPTEPMASPEASNPPTSAEGTVSIVPTSQDIAQKAADIKQALATQNQEIADQKEHQRRMEGDELYAYAHGGAAGLQSSFLDPLEFKLWEAAATPVLMGAAKLIDAATMNPYIRTMFQKMTPEAKDEMKATINFADEQGIKLTDAFVEGTTGHDLRQYITGANLFGVRESQRSMEKMGTEYLNMIQNSVTKLNAKGIDPNNINTWRDIRQAENIVSGEVEGLRAKLKAEEGAAYNLVEKELKGYKEEFRVDEAHKEIVKTLTDEGVPVPAVNAVKNILNRFNRPYLDETKELKALQGERSELLVKSKTLKAQSDAAIASGDTAKAVSIEGQIQDLRGKFKELSARESDLKDVRYLTIEQVMDNIKQINHKIFSPGGSISVSDAMEIRGLFIAKSKLEDFVEQNLKDGPLKEKIRAAKDITINRTTLFGPKDSGGEKLMLANMLNVGDYTKVNQYLTGPSAKENILYIRDVFGKDSEAYRSSLSLYLNDKLGLTPDAINSVLKRNKAFGITGEVDIQKAAAKISSLDAQDFAMVRQVMGEKEALNLRAVQKLMMNFADLEEASVKYGRGITGGKASYVWGDANPLGMMGRGIKLVKDAIIFKAANTAEKIIYNQPKFRTLTGAITGETVYLANHEDVTLEGTIMAMLTGGAAGYVGGRLTRSMFESDISKVTRYLKEGKPIGADMPNEIVDALGRLGKAQKELEDFAMKQVQPRPLTPGQTENIKEMAYQAGSKLNEATKGLFDPRKPIVDMGGPAIPPTKPAINFTYKVDDLADGLLAKYKAGTDNMPTMTISNYLRVLKKAGASDDDLNRIVPTLLKDNKAEDRVSLDKLVTSTKGAPKIEEQAGNNQYNNVTLGEEGKGNPTYTERVNTLPGKELPDNAGAPLDQVHFKAPEGSNTLGWARTHVDNINGKDTLVVNELQSDWDGAVRAMIDAKYPDANKNAILAAKMDKDIKNRIASGKDNQLLDEESFNNLYMQYGKQAALLADKHGDDYIKAEIATIKGKLGVDQTYEAINKAEDLINSGKALSSKEVEYVSNSYKAMSYEIYLEGEMIPPLKAVPNMPINPSKMYQTMIVKSIDDAISKGIDRIAIPLDRGELNSLGMAYQGRGRELAGSPSVSKFYDKVDKELLPAIKRELGKQGMSISLTKEPYQVTKGKNTFDNTLAVISIDKVPNKAVKWDIMGIAGALGLTKYVEVANGLQKEKREN